MPSHSCSLPVALSSSAVCSRERLAGARGRLALAGQDGRQADAPPGVLGGRANFGDPLGQRLNLIVRRSRSSARLQWVDPGSEIGVRGRPRPSSLAKCADGLESG